MNPLTTAELHTQFGREIRKERERSFDETNVDQKLRIA